MGHAMDMILTGRAVSASEALSMGLVNRVVAKGTARQAAEKLASELAGLPQVCMRHDRLSAYQQWDMDYAQAMANEFDHGIASMASGAAVTGAARFAYRGERMIFRHVNFELGPGQALILHGPNGSGKTTLLRVIAGLLGLMAGRLRMLGANDQLLTDEAHDRAFHFVSHLGIVRSQMRVRETLEFHAAILGAPKTAVANALDDWALRPLADHSGGMLSAGQRHRLALARLSSTNRSLRWTLRRRPVSTISRRSISRVAASSSPQVTNRF
jgi:ABC-type transport system involved in cytochrome c biogenesis ATPase subunit